MTGSLVLRNRCNAKGVDIRALRQRVQRTMSELGRDTYDLSIYLVDDQDITRINETRLRHAGVTDVITFDLSDRAWLDLIAGEIFVCVPEALRQATRFKVPAEQELFRYIVHGILHLLGYDDGTTLKRRRMKRVESRLVARL